MIKSLLVLSLLLCPTFVHGAEAAAEKNFLKNGGFEKGIAGWRGDGKKLLEGRNGVLSIAAARKSDKVISQKVLTKGSKTLTFTMRYKVTEGFDTNGVTIRFEESSGRATTTTFDPEVEKAGEWLEYSWNVTGLLYPKRLKLSIIVQPGTGEIHFDDLKFTKRT